MNLQTGTFLSMDNYQGNAYDPGSLHKYTYAQNNPEMYNDPGGHFIVVVGVSVSMSCREIMRNSQALHVMGMISGMMNTIISQVLGSEDDPGTAFIKGYLVGVGFFAYFQGISLNYLVMAITAGAVWAMTKRLWYTPRYRC